jgi:hypothetical protein
MNFITSDSAYSLYPYATFIRQHALSFASHRPCDQAAITKYANQGWSFTSNRLPMDTGQAQRWFFLGKRRRLVDRHTWRVSLNPAEKDTLPDLPLTPTAQTLLWDPVLPSSWALCRERDLYGWKMTPSYVITKPAIFKYSYVVSDRVRVDECLQFFTDQAVIEHAKVADVDGDDENDENDDDESKALRWKWSAPVHKSSPVEHLC